MRAELTAANQRRTAAGAARTTAAVAEALEVMDANCPPVWQQVARLRLDNPALSLRELADKLDMTKDAYAGALRRIIREGERIRAKQGR